MQTRECVPSAMAWETGLDEVRNASLAAKNVVVSPAALKAAQYLQKKFGTPYEIFLSTGIRTCAGSELSRKEDPDPYSSR